VVQRDALRPWRYPPRCEYLYGEWLRDEVESGLQLSPFLSPDLAVVLSVAAEHGRTLVGPPIGSVLDPGPPADVVRGALAGVTELLADLPQDTANVLLTLARMRVTVETGRVVPKDDAVDRLLPRAPDRVRQPLQRARAVYLGLQPDRWDDLAPSIEAAEWLRAGLPDAG
jgi:streptomycin 3"-adenylyltransferase